MSPRKPVIIIAILLCLSASIPAQQIQYRAETGLVLEVVYFSNTAPAYQKVSWSYDKNGGAWYARFGRIPNWQLPPGELPIQAIRLVPYLQAGMVTIHVSVLRGTKFQDAEDIVASYDVRENDTVTAEGLRKFGIEPFVIKVVRVAPAVPNPPTIQNKTNSLAIIAIEPIISSLPAYKVIVRNVSTKNISALGVRVLRNEKVAISSLPQGKDGAVLIKAGEVGELYEPLGTKAEPVPGGYSPSTYEENQILIASLVFEDGTYEGEAESAALYRGFSMGRQTELKRLTPILARVLSGSEADLPDAAARLASEMKSLSYEIDDADVESLVGAFPTLTKERLRSSIEIGVHGVRKDLLDQLAALQSGQYAGAASFRTWLIAANDRYSKWLSRLTGESVSHR